MSRQSKRLPMRSDLYENNKMTLILLSVLLISVFIFGGPLLDRIIIKSYRYPLYSEYISEGYGIPLYMVNADSEINNSQYKNLVINALQPRQIGELSMTVNRDGSVTLDGQYFGDNSSYMMSPTGFRLSDGDYVISAGNALQDQEHCRFYIEGWQETEEGIKKEILAMTPDRTEFHIESEKYDRFWYGINIIDGFSADNEILYPVISDAGNIDVIPEYFSCAVRNYSGDEDASRFVIYYLTKNDYERIPENDWAVFAHNLRYQFRGKYEWCSILFEDGTGIQYQDFASKKMSYGLVDTYGRIIREYRQLELDDFGLGDRF